MKLELTLILVLLSNLTFCQVVNFHSGEFEYFAYYGTYEDSVYGATEQCQLSGGKLADIPDYWTFSFFNETLTELLPEVPAYYIDTWQNDDYYPYCLAFYIGAMVNQPDNGCDGPMPYICQVERST